MRKHITLNTLPNAPSPSSPIISQISSGLTSLCTCSYCFFFLSGPNLKIFRKLKKDIVPDVNYSAVDASLGDFRQEEEEEEKKNSGSSRLDNS